MKIFPTTRRFQGRFLACYVCRHGNTGSTKLLSLAGMSKGDARKLAAQLVARIRALHRVPPNA